MMCKLFTSFLMIILAWVDLTDSFAPPALQAKNMNVNVRESLKLAMSEESSSKPTTETSASTELKVPPASGTFYDDEVNPIPASKQELSSSMRDRLIREASAGLDSEKKQTNVLLYIMGAVGILVLLGGQGIFF